MAIIPKDWTISAKRYRGPRPSSGDSKQSNSEHKGSTTDEETDDNATLMGIKLSFLLKVLFSRVLSLSADMGFLLIYIRLPAKYLALSRLL